MDLETRLNKQICLVFCPANVTSARFSHLAENFLRNRREVCFIGWRKSGGKFKSRKNYHREWNSRLRN